MQLLREIVADLERAWHPASGTPRLAHSLLQGMKELNALFPLRPQGAQEGTLGDATHRAEGTGSDHNPNAAGVVRAWDIDCTPGVVPFDPQVLANRLAAMMRTANQYNFFGSRGYVIYNRRITAWNPWGSWVPYTGADPHTHHIHLSVGANAAEYDDAEAWNLAAAFPKPAPKPAPNPATKPVLPPVQPVIPPAAAHDELYVRFINSGPKNNSSAVYRVCGSQLAFISGMEYAWLGKPPCRVLDSRSVFWKFPVVAGSLDYRGK